MGTNNLETNCLYNQTKPYKLCVSECTHLNIVAAEINFSEEKILEAASAAASWDTVASHLFSLNDVYVHLGFQPGRSVSWAKRQEILSPGIIRAVLKKSGFKSIQRSGGANVSRYYLSVPKGVRTEADIHDEIGMTLRGILREMIREDPELIKNFYGEAK